MHKMNGVGVDSRAGKSGGTSWGGVEGQTRNGTSILTAGV